MCQCHQLLSFESSYHNHPNNSKGGGHIRAVIATIVAVSVVLAGVNISAEQAQEKTESSQVTGSSGETGNPRISSDKSANEPPQQWRTFEATAYVALCDTGCTGITRTGIDVRQTRYHEGRVIVAVDPDVIPLGSALIIRLADGSEIDAIALDTGGRIRGNKVDVLMAREADAWEFGRQAVEVKILDW